MSRATEAFLDILADLVAERLNRRTSVPGQGDVYTSFALPPDCPSRERFNRLVKALPGASKRGRCWSVPREAWVAFRSPEVRPASPRELAERAARAAGFRRVV